MVTGLLPLLTAIVPAAAAVSRSALVVVAGMSSARCLRLFFVLPAV